MDSRIVLAKGERGWIAACDIPQETLLGCEGPWLRPEKSVLSPSHARDWRLTEVYIERHKTWERKHVFLKAKLADDLTSDLWKQALAKWESDLGNLSVFLRSLKHNTTKQVPPKDFQLLALEIAKKFEVPLETVLLIHNVMATNCFTPGCFLYSSYVNHSCDHNASIIWSPMSMQKVDLEGKLVRVSLSCPTCEFKDPEHDRLHFLLLKDVKKGDEITINYLSRHPETLAKTQIGSNQCNATVGLADTIPNKKRRRRLLLDRFGFFCTCPCCLK